MQKCLSALIIAIITFVLQNEILYLLCDYHSQLNEMFSVIDETKQSFSLIIEIMFTISLFTLNEPVLK